MSWTIIIIIKRKKKRIRRKIFKSLNFHFSQTGWLTAFHKEIDWVCVTLSLSPQFWWMFTLRAREHVLLHRMRKAGSSSCSLPLDRQGHGLLASHHSISLFPILNSCKIKQWCITLWVLRSLTDSCDNRCGFFLLLFSFLCSTCIQVHEGYLQKKIETCFENATK